MYEEQGGPHPNHNNGDGMSSVGTSSPDMFVTSSCDDSKSFERSRMQPEARGFNINNHQNDIIITENDLESGKPTFSHIFCLFSW